jgi:hypothetical protein
MNDDWHDAGRIRWEDPATAWLLTALAKHPQRENIRELKWERDDEGCAAGC